MRHFSIVILCLVLAPSQASAQNPRIPHADPEAMKAELSARGLTFASPAPTAQAGGRKLALCIGIDGYQAEDYAPLKFAVADAKALSKALGEAGYEVTLMTDDAADPELRPTYARLDQQLLKFARSSRSLDDTIIVTFAGHGDVIGKQTGLLPLDWDQERRMIRMDQLLGYFGDADCRAGKKLLILDACRSSAERPDRRMANGFLQALAAPESMVLLTGCTEDQSSFEDPTLGHGRLTHVLLQGLKGEAYGKDKRALLASDWKDYVQQEFRERGWAKEQSPQWLGREDGRIEFDIAKRRLPKPEPLSNYGRAALTKAIDDGFAAWGHREYWTTVDAATVALRIDEQSADAMGLRALAYQSLGYREEVKQEVGASLAIDSQNAIALQVRAYEAFNREDWQAAKQTLERVDALLEANRDRWEWLRMPGQAAPRTFRRGFTYEKLLKFDRAIADYTRVIEMTGAPSGQVVEALISRGAVYDRELQPEMAIADYTRVIDTADSSSRHLATALIRRGYAQRLKDPESAIADYSRVIEMKNAPVDQAAIALIHRGALFTHSLQEPQRAISDFTRVIGMKNASPEALAMAVMRRNDAYAAQAKSSFIKRLLRLPGGASATPEAATQPTSPGR